MVTELKEVIQKMEQLSEEEQRMIAKLLQDEILWDNTLKHSQDTLSKLADEAVAEHRSGKTKDLDW